MSIIIEFHNLNKTEILDKNQKQTRAFYIVDKDKKMLQINTIPDSQMSLPVDQIKSFSQTILFNELGMRKMSDLIASIIDTPVASAQRINDALPLQQIFYGAPGTGKSHSVCEVTKNLPKEDVFRITFHPDSDYASFVGCYKPTETEGFRYGINGANTVMMVDPDNGGAPLVEKKITYRFVPQAFINAYVRAYHTDSPVFLVIEEINRGNCAQIFGDMFQLLDRGDSGESDYAIKPDTDIQDYLAKVMTDAHTDDEAIKQGVEMKLPANLYIWATMNTSDQSLFPIDSAFKRRWDWKYMPIDYEKEKWSIVAKSVQYSWSDFLKKINNLVASLTDSEDKMLGFYFAKAKDGIIDADTFVGKVVFYLWNDLFKDYGLPKEILKGAESKEFAFRNFFMADGHANEDMVKRLLDNLEVTKLTDTDFPVEGPENQDEALHF